MKNSFILLFAFLVISTSLLAQKSASVGVVDVQRVLNDYSAFQVAVEKVRGSVAPVEEEMQKMQENIQTIVAEGQAAETKSNNPAASEEARAEAAVELNDLRQKLQLAQSEINQFRQQAQQLAQQGQQEKLAPLQEKAVEAVKSVALEKGIDLVVPKNQVIYSSEALDISEAVIDLLNDGE